MSRFLPGIVALAMLVITGVVHGIQSDRWGDGSDLVAAASRLEKIPTVVGDWYSEPEEIPRTQLDAAGAVGYFGRQYTHRLTGNSVSVSILCGKSGPMAVHPPTICFVGAGWQLLGPVKKRKVEVSKGSPTAEFWQGEFSRNAGGISSQIRTLWSWGTTGTWQAAEFPRQAFAGSGHLYKVYVTTRMSDLADPSAVDPTNDFLKLFLPQVKSSLQAKP